MYAGWAGLLGGAFATELLRWSFCDGAFATELLRRSFGDGASATGPAIAEPLIAEAVLAEPVIAGVVRAEPVIGAPVPMVL